MPPVFNIDAVAEIRRDSITIDWTQLTGLETGGVGVEITAYEIAYRQQALDSLTGLWEDVAGSAAQV